MRRERLRGPRTSAALELVALAALGSFYQGLRLNRLLRDADTSFADGEGGDRPEENDAGTDPHGRVHAVDERVGSPVAAVGREDRGEHCHPEHAAKLADRVLRPGR